jgi:hypothetical protein
MDGNGRIILHMVYIVRNCQEAIPLSLFNQKPNDTMIRVHIEYTKASFGVCEIQQIMPKVAEIVAGALENVRPVDVEVVFTDLSEQLGVYRFQSPFTTIAVYAHHTDWRYEQGEQIVRNITSGFREECPELTKNVMKGPGDAVVLRLHLERMSGVMF